jgi:hypothetical protein
MSRSGYSDDYDQEQWALIRWRGAVKSAIRGKRGQALLKEMLEALEAMPVKSLTTGLLESDGEVCAFGALGIKRGMNMSVIDPEDYEQVAKDFGTSQALAREIMYENDECGWHETGEQLWQRMREWVRSQLKS